MAAVVARALDSAMVHRVTEAVVARALDSAVVHRVTEAMVAGGVMARAVGSGMRRGVSNQVHCNAGHPARNGNETRNQMGIR